MDVAFPDIEAARARIRQAIFESPCAHSETLSKRTGCKRWLKLENLQMIMPEGTPLIKVQSTRGFDHIEQIEKALLAAGHREVA